MPAPGEVEAGISEVQGHFYLLAVQNLRLAWERWKPRLKYLPNQRTEKKNLFLETLR